MHSVMNAFKDVVDSSSLRLQERTIGRLCERLMHMILERQYSTFILDLSHFPSLHSSDLMMLVPVLSLAQKLQQQVIFCGVTAETQLVFELTQLDQAFTVIQDIL